MNLPSNDNQLYSNSSPVLASYCHEYCAAGRNLQSALYPFRVSYPIFTRRQLLSTPRLCPQFVHGVVLCQLRLLRACNVYYCTVTIMHYNLNLALKDIHVCYMQQLVKCSLPTLFRTQFQYIANSASKKLRERDTKIQNNNIVQFV